MLPPDADQPSTAGDPPVPPPPASLPVAIRDARMFWWVTLGVIAVDQISKAIVYVTLPLFHHQPFIKGFLDFVHVRNAGVAFGFLNDVNLPHKGLFTAGLAVIALIGIWFYARHLRHEEFLARTGLSLILGGAIGNLADRVRVGYVVDFVDVYWKDWHFWAFNLADAAITIGAVLVFLDLLLVKRHAPHTV